MSHDAEDIRKHVRVYIAVFVSLALLTGVTVGVSYLHMPKVPAIALALTVAVIKGSLVCLYFMHLISERKIIIWVMALTVSFFVALMALPVLTERGLGPLWPLAATKAG